MLKKKHIVWLQGISILLVLFIVYVLYIEITLDDIEVKQGAIIGAPHCEHLFKRNQYLNLTAKYEGEKLPVDESIYINLKYKCDNNFEERVRKIGKITVTYAGDYYLRVILGGVVVQDFDEDSFFKKASKEAFFSFLLIFLFCYFMVFLVAFNEKKRDSK